MLHLMFTIITLKQFWRDADLIHFFIRICDVVFSSNVKNVKNEPTQQSSVVIIKVLVKIYTFLSFLPLYSEFSICSIIVAVR